MNERITIPQAEGKCVAGPLSILVSHDQTGFIFYKVGNNTSTTEPHFVFKVRQHVEVKIEFVEKTSLINFIFQSNQTIALKLTNDFFTALENLFSQKIGHVHESRMLFTHIECLPTFRGPAVSIVYTSNGIEGYLLNTKESKAVSQKLFNKEKQMGEDLFLMQFQQYLKRAFPRG
jgi:hypothetical protein